MSHVVTIKQHPTNPDIVCLCTPPDMATIMGGFGPARYVGNAPPINGASYVISTEDLPRFSVYCTNRATHLVDARRTTTTRPAHAEQPLPECIHCGQPARRGTHLEHCPNCGAPWEPVQAPHA
jgi:hypothetical protein